MRPASRPSASGPADGSPGERAARAEAGRRRLSGSEAGRAVLAAIEAHGGLDAWFEAGAIAFRYDYQPVEGVRRASYQVVDVLGARAYHEITYPMEGRFAFDGERAWMMLPEGEEYAARFWALTPYYFVGMPFVLSDRGVKLSLSSDDPQRAGFPVGTRVIRVTFAPGTGDAPDDYYVLYLDEKTSRLLGLRYVVSYAPFMAGTDMAHTPEKLLVYEDIEAAGPLKLARKHEFFAFNEGKKGEKVTLATVEDIEVGVPFDASRLEMPEGARIDDSLEKARAR